MSFKEKADEQETLRMKNMKHYSDYSSHQKRYSTHLFLHTLYCAHSKIKEVEVGGIQRHKSFKVHKQNEETGEISFALIFTP